MWKSPSPPWVAGFSVVFHRPGGAVRACPEVRRILRYTTADVRERPQVMIHEIRQALAGR